MQSIAQTVPLVAKADKSVLVGRGLSGLVVLFMVFDGVSKVVVERHVVKAMTELGWPPEQTVGLGILVIACTAIYVIPRTSIVGAILLRGFLGGATAAKVCIEEASALVSIAMGVLVWLGLFLRRAAPGAATRATVGTAMSAARRGSAIAAYPVFSSDLHGPNVVSATA